MHWDMVGAAWAKNITDFTNAVIVTLYLFIMKPCEKSQIS